MTIERTFSHLFRRLALAVGLTGLALLAACGGGSGGSTSSSSSAQSASGMVTGFGSVMVDGTEYQDLQAAVQRENGDGSFSNVALGLGQRVEVANDGQGNATHISVDAALMGAVSAVDATGFQAAGQRVNINADASAGPLTWFGGGYGSLADVTVGDLVEVHGNLVYNSALNAYVIAATRVDKQSASTGLRVMGLVSGLDTTAKTFRINGLTVAYGSATVVPADTSLANGQMVAAWGGGGALSGSGASLALAASRVRIMNGPHAGNVASGSARIGGVVSNYDSTAQTLSLQGVTVSLANANVLPAGALLANGAYIVVQGVFGGDGVLAASQVTVREANTGSDTARVELIGLIDSYTDATSFVVRGIPVDASTAAVAASCANVTLAAGVLVDVVGHAQAGTDVVKADSLACRAAPPAMVIRVLRGSVSGVDTTAMTFTLTLANATTQAVQWNAQTAFLGNLSGTTLNTATVEVTGYLNGQVLVARQISPAGSTLADQFAPGGSGWSQYNLKFRPGQH